MRKVVSLCLVLFLCLVSCSEKSNSIVDSKAPDIISNKNNLQKVSIVNSNNIEYAVKFWDGTGYSGNSHMGVQIDLEGLDNGTNTYWALTDAVNDENSYLNYYVSAKFVENTYYTDNKKIVIEQPNTNSKWMCGNSVNDRINFSSNNIFSFEDWDNSHPNEFPRYVWVRIKTTKTGIPTLDFDGIIGPTTLYGFPTNKDLKDIGTKELEYEASGTWEVEPEGGTGNYYYKWYFKYPTSGWILQTQGAGEGFRKFRKTITGYGTFYLKCEVSSGIQAKSETLEI